MQAVGALRPFQFGLEADDDEEALEDDRVRAELMRAMVSDSSPDVRQAALAAVTKTVGMFDQVSGGGRRGREGGGGFFVDVHVW